MARLIVIIPLLILVGVKLFTWYAKRRTAQVQSAQAQSATAEAKAAQRVDPTAFGLPANTELDSKQAGPPHEHTAVVDAATAAAEAGDWQPFAEYLAGAGDDWNLRFHRLRPIAEYAAKEDGWLKAWRAAAPEDPDAALVHAYSMIELAWEVRSAKQAKYVSREQADAFHRILHEAIEACHAAAELAPADPSPWVSQLPIAMGLGWPREQFDAVWQEIVTRAPHHYSAHLTALQYNCAKWRGSHEEMFEFAEKAAVSAPPESLLSILRLNAIHELEVTQDDYKAWMTPEANRAIDQVLADMRTVPADDFRLPGLRHLLAFGLTHNRRFAEAVEQFRLIDRYIGAAPWSYTGNPASTFAQIRDRALTGWDKAGRPAA